MKNGNGNGNGGEDRRGHLAWGESDLEFHSQNESIVQGDEDAPAEMPRSIFNYRLSRDVVVVEDLHDDANQAMSVTNDAERVVSYLHGTGILENRRLVYRDTDGRWDELKHDGHGKFVGFAPIGALTEEAAVAAARGEKDDDAA